MKQNLRRRQEKRKRRQAPARQRPGETRRRPEEPLTRKDGERGQVEPKKPQKNIEEEDRDDRRSTRGAWRRKRDVKSREGR